MSERPTVAMDGRRALVTGGASGIGKATAQRFAELGATVVIADLDGERGAAVAAAIGATMVELDVSDAAAWERLVDGHGDFDVAFLNAGVATRRGLPAGGGNPVLELSDADYRRVMGANVDGVVFGARAVLPAMTAAGGGDIVVTASIAGLHPIGPDPIYGLTKHGVVGFVRSMASWLTQQPGAPDICISSVNPGFADTDILSADTKASIGALGVELLHPDDVADAVVLALAERVQGAQWTVWPGIAPRVYAWNPAISPDERPSGVFQQVDE